MSFVLAKPLTALVGYQSERAEAILALLGINFLAAAATIFFFSRLCLLATCNKWPAALAAFGLFTTNAFLNYAHSGTSYLPGLTSLIAGIYYAALDPEADKLWTSMLAGMMYALAVLLWFPYLFVLPAAFVTPFVMGEYDRRYLKKVLWTIATCAAVGILTYTTVIAILRISDSSSLKDWITAAGHGQVQAGGMRAIARLAFSVPRSFINMNRDGMWLKRYLIHDPYAPVSMGMLAQLNLWKLAFFYGWIGWLVVELLRNKRGRKLALWLALASAPVLLFALLIFEAGSIERYLPLYPFVFVALANVLASKNTGTTSKVAISVMVVVMATVNISAMLWESAEGRKAATVARIRDVLPSLGPDVLLVAVNEQDDLAEFRQNFPLDPVNINLDWQTYDLLEINSQRVVTWRSDFARRALAAWRRGGEVWAPTRVFRARPDPQWNWVEGDDQRVKWADLPAFFVPLDSGPVPDGDAFVRLTNDSRNASMLELALSRGTLIPSAQGP